MNWRWFHAIWALASILSVVSGTGMWIERDRAEARETHLLHRLNSFCNGVHDALDQAESVGAAGDRGTAAQIFLRIERDLHFCAPGAPPRDPFDAGSWLERIPVRDLDDPTLGESP